MNPWVILGGVLLLASVAGGAYWQGRQDGKDSQLAEAARDEQVAAIASEAAADAIAKAIPTITVKHQTIRQELEKEIHENPVYLRSECDTGPGSLQRFNAAITGAAATPPDRGAVPASGAGD